MQDILVLHIDKICLIIRRFQFLVENLVFRNIFMIWWYKFFFWTYVPSRPNGRSITVIRVLYVIHPANIYSASIVLCTEFALCYVLLSIYFFPNPQSYFTGTGTITRLCLCILRGWQTVNSNKKIQIRMSYYTLQFKCVFDKYACFKIKWIFIHNVCWAYLCIFSNSLLLKVRSNFSYYIYYLAVW